MSEHSAVALSSVVVAVAALLFSILAFRSQQERAERHARASVKPLLWIHSQTYDDLKSVQLTNHGLGPAIVKRAEFKKGGVSTNRIVDLFGLTVDGPHGSKQLLWETFVNLQPGRAIPTQSTIVLVKQSLTHLVGQGIDEQTGLQLLREWQTQKSGITVHIQYDDIYGNEMDPLIDTLA